MRHQLDVCVLATGRIFTPFSQLTCHNGVFRLESKVLTANPALYLRDVSWLLVTVGLVV